MKRDFSIEIKTVEGTSYADKPTVKTMFMQAFGQALRGDSEMSNEQIMKVLELADRIAKGPVVELATEDVAMVKERLKKYGGFGPLVVAMAFRALEADYVEPAAEDQKPAAAEA